MLHVTISHNKPQQEVIQSVDRSIDSMFQTMAVGLVQIVDPVKSWTGNTMTFSLTAKAGFLTTPIRGTVVVTDKEVIMDADIGIFQKFISEEKAKSLMETQVRGLIASGSNEKP